MMICIEVILVTPNFRTIMHWNSSYFLLLSIVTMADGVANKNKYTANSTLNHVSSDIKHSDLPNKENIMYQHRDWEGSLLDFPVNKVICVGSNYAKPHKRDGLGAL